MHERQRSLDEGGDLRRWQLGEEALQDARLFAKHPLDRRLVDGEHFRREPSLAGETGGLCLAPKLHEPRLVAEAEALELAEIARVDARALRRRAHVRLLRRGL